MKSSVSTHVVEYFPVPSLCYSLSSDVVSAALFGCCCQILLTRSRLPIGCGIPHSIGDISFHDIATNHIVLVIDRFQTHIQCLGLGCAIMIINVTMNTPTALCIDALYFFISFILRGMSALEALFYIDNVGI